MLLVIVIISFLLNCFACAPLKQKGDFLDDNFSVQASTFEKKSTKSKDSDTDSDKTADEKSDGKSDDTSDSDSDKDSSTKGDDEFEGSDIPEEGDNLPSLYL